MTLPADTRRLYAAPKVVTLQPGSWQAGLVADCESLHHSGKQRMIVVVVGNGPVRWFVTLPQGQGNGR